MSCEDGGARLRIEREDVGLAELLTAAADVKRYDPTQVVRLPVDIDQAKNQIQNQMSSGWAISDALFLSHQIAKGSNGTLVYKGTYRGHPVAVKRLVKDLHDDSLEIKCLTHSNTHPNVIHFYGMEEDDDFVYLILELCDFSLYDLVKSKKHPELWPISSFPSPELLVLMRGIVAGIVHLHSLGFVHVNLKPSNVLMAGVHPKISGLGSCRLLPEVVELSSGDDDDDDDTDWEFAKLGLLQPLTDTSYWNFAKLESLYGWLNNETSGWELRKLLCWEFTNFFDLGYGGWRAPEFLSLGLQNPPMDVFALGCVLFFCLTRGMHLFGNPIHFRHDSNVIENYPHYFYLVRHIPEAINLIPQVVNPNFEERPKASKVLRHPLFWIPKTRLSFLSDAGKWVEMEHKKASSVLGALEDKGAYRTWDLEMDDAFISQMTQRGHYKQNMVEDLLRIIHHTKNDYQELPTNIQNVLGAMPEGVDLYFRERFPALLMDVYDAVYDFCKQEEWFRKYRKMVKEVQGSMLSYHVV